MKLHIIAMTFVLLVSGCSVKNFSYMENNVSKQHITTKVSDVEYQKDLRFQWKIAKGDRLEIQAYNQSSNSAAGQLTQLLSSGGQKTFTQRYGDEGILVPTTGIIRLPLIGAVKITGLTEDEASKLLIKKYKHYLKHPYVSVKILNQKLFVVGEVKKPGVVLVTNGTMNLFEALAQTGDLTDYANRTNITVLRGDMRNPEVREINLNDFESMKLSSLILRPNDVVYVRPRESKAGVVGVQENIPFWELIGKILAPFSSSAVLYEVVK